MPFLSDLARRKKIRYFIDRISKTDRVLEIGCGDGWVAHYMRSHGWTNYVGVDIAPPADVVGDIRQWAKLGLQQNSFDVIIAFEVVEHVNCFKECYELLGPGGVLMATSPVPHFDWVMKLLETVGLNRKRTSPHDQLIYFERIPYFQQKHIETIGGLSQWGIFTKTSTVSRP